MVKRIIALVLCLLMVASLAVGCGTKATTQTSATPSATPEASKAAEATPTPDAASAISGEITYLSGQANWLETFYPEMIKEFNAKYPNIKVTVDAIEGYEETLKIKMSSDDLPDVFDSYNNTPSAEQREAFLLPLDDTASAAKIDPAFQSFFKGADGKVYAMPYAKDISGIIIYNKKIFKDLNISVPKTLDELIAAGKKIKDAGYVAGLAMCSKDQWTMCQFDEGGPRFFSGDPNVFNNQLDINSDTPFTLDGPWGKTFTLIDTLVKSGIVNDSPNSYGWEPMKADFKANKIGMFYMASWFVSQSVADDLIDTAGDYVGVFAMPIDNSGKLYTKSGPLPGLSISKSTKNPEAAKAFVDFMCIDYNEKLTKAQTGFSTNPDVKVVYNWSTDLVSENMAETPKSSDITNIWNNGAVDFSAKASAVAGGEMTPQEAIDAMNASWAAGRAAK